MLAVCKGGVAVDIYVKFSDHFFFSNKCPQKWERWQFVLETIF